MPSWRRKKIERDYISLNNHWVGMDRRKIQRSIGGFILNNTFIVIMCCCGNKDYTSIIESVVTHLLLVYIMNIYFWYRMDLTAVLSLDLKILLISGDQKGILNILPKQT